MEFNFCLPLAVLSATVFVEHVNRIQSRRNYLNWVSRSSRVASHKTLTTSVQTAHSPKSRSLRNSANTLEFNAQTVQTAQTPGHAKLSADIGSFLRKHDAIYREVVQA